MKYRIHVQNSETPSHNEKSLSCISEDGRTKADILFEEGQQGQVWVAVVSGYHFWCEPQYEQIREITSMLGLGYVREQQVQNLGFSLEELEQFRKLVCLDRNLAYKNPYSPPHTWGQALAAQQALNKLFNLPPEVALTPQLLEFAKKHIHTVQSRLISQLKEGKVPHVVVSEAHANTMYKDLMVKNWTSSTLTTEVPFYSLWKSILIDWAQSQELVLSFKVEGSSRLANSLLTIKATSAVQYPTDTLSVEELMQIATRGR